ncbi:MAG: hypothetical protein R2827_14060 [Bdellovibrionales bacterium]
MTKYLLSLGLLFSVNSYASGTPFDSFIGTYNVVNAQCTDLIENVDVQPKINKIQIFSNGNPGEIWILRTGEGYQHEFNYTSSPEFFNSRFSGNGVSKASWSQDVEDLNYKYEVSISKATGKYLFTWLYKFLGASPTAHVHTYCEYELEKH